MKSRMIRRLVTLPLTTPMSATEEILHPPNLTASVLHIMFLFMKKSPKLLFPKIAVAQFPAALLEDLMQEELLTITLEVVWLNAAN